MAIATSGAASAACITTDCTQARLRSATASRAATCVDRRNRPSTAMARPYQLLGGRDRAAGRTARLAPPRRTLLSRAACLWCFSDRRREPRLRSHHRRGRRRRQRLAVGAEAPCGAARFSSGRGRERPPARAGPCLRRLFAAASAERAREPDGGRPDPRFRRLAPGPIRGRWRPCRRRWPRAAATSAPLSPQGRSLATTSRSASPRP
jgi:hypothetical protein